MSRPKFSFPLPKYLGAINKEKALLAEKREELFEYGKKLIYMLTDVQTMESRIFKRLKRIYWQTKEKILRSQEFGVDICRMACYNNYILYF